MSGDRIIRRSGVNYSVRRRAGWWLVDRVACDCILGPHAHDVGARRTYAEAVELVESDRRQLQELGS